MRLGNLSDLTVTKLPAKPPNGRDYHIEAFTDDHTLLVTIGPGRWSCGLS